MTKQELKAALDYANNEIEKKYGDKDYFYYGEIEIPEVGDLVSVQRDFYLKELRELIKIKMKDTSFKNEFILRMITQIEKLENMTSVLHHFHKRDLDEMMEKGYPIEQVMKCETVDVNSEIAKDFIKYLVNEVRTRINNNLVDFYMTYAEKLSLLEILNFFSFDDIKQQELKFISECKKRKTEGLKFGVNSSYLQHMECILPSGAELSEETSADFINQYKEKETLAHFFDNIRNRIFLEVGIKDQLLERSINKEWTKEYIKCKEKDYNYVSYVLELLNGYQNQIIYDKKIISTPNKQIIL